MTKTKQIKIQASSWARVQACPGSLFLEQTLPEGERYNPFKDAASFGSQAHDIAEKALVNDTAPLAEMKKAGISKGHPDFDRVKQTVKDYVEYVRKLRGYVKGELQVESKTRLEFMGFDCVAKSDAIIISSGKTQILDLKTGNYDYRETSRPQIEYTAFVLAHALPAQAQNDFIGHIIQPFFWDETYQAGSFDISAHDIGHIALTLQLFAHKEEKKTEFNAGQHCAFCPSLRICPSCRLDVATVERTLDLSNGDLTRLDGDSLSRLWYGKKRMLAFLESLDDVIMDRLVAGKEVPGVTIENGKGRRAWIDTDIVKAKLEYLGEEMYETKLKSPAQMEKIAGKENIKGLTDTPVIKKLAKAEALPFEIVEEDGK